MWDKLSFEILEILSRLKNKQVPFLDYAKNYARFIPQSVEDGECLGYSPEESVKTQMLYVLSNLEGVDKISLNLINNICRENNIDISRTVKDMVRDID